MKKFYSVHVYERDSDKSDVVLVNDDKDAAIAVYRVLVHNLNKVCTIREWGNGCWCEVYGN